MRKQLGPYSLRGELGRGAMGVTYRAWSEAHGREVALKLCAPGLATAEECARLVREGRLLAEVDHPFVVGALDAGEHLGVPYLVMELVEGETLAERLRSGGPFTPQAGARLVRQIAEGVGELHRRGIVHRDLKPENVLLDRRGSPRVCDLGVARGEALSRLTETGAVLGTPAFLAPEQARGEAVGPPADVYALGVLLFVVLTGSPPFTGSLPQVLEAQASAAPPGLLSRCPLASRELAAVVACCLEKDPADRYRTADELAAALAPLAHGARSSGATRWALAGSLCAAAAGVVGVFVALHGRAPRPPQAAPEAPAAGVAEPPASAEADARLAQAGEALRAERYREAWERFAAARDDDPEAPEPWLGLARTAALEGRHDLAFTCFRRVLELAPDHRGGGVALIHMLAERGDPAEAAARLEEARGRWGDAPDVEVAAARLELRCGESDDARRRLEEVLARAPEEPDAWILYGEVCLAQGDDSAGLAALRRGKELEPLPLNAANYLAHWFQSGAALDAVCEEVERERGLHPDSVELGKLHAVLCVARRDGQPLRALELLTELCAREPFVLTLHLARADLLGALGVRPELAQEDLDFVLEHDPTLPQALFARCELAQAQEDGPSAWALAKRFAESEPGNPRAWVLRVEAAYRAGELEDFGLAAEAAWTTFPDERGAASIAARYAQSGEPERALEWVRAGRAAYPQSDALSAVEACCRLLASGDPRAEDDARALLGHPWPLLATLSRFSLLSVALQDRARCSPEEVLRWGAELEQVGGRDPCVLTLLARLSSREGYYAHAQRLLGWSLTQQPGNAEALACLAALYATHGGAAEAVGLAQVAVRCARARGQEPLPQAGVLAEQEGWSGGEQLLQGPEALLRLATEAFEAYELPRAHVYARALLAREPRSVEGWLLLGRVAGRRGRLPDAVLALSRVLSLDPRHAEALAHLLQARVKQARYDEAQALARRLRALGASGFSARSAELYLLFSSAGMTAATAQAQALLRDFPEEEDALLTWVLVRGASDPAAARAQLLGYLREHPRSTGWEQLVNSFWPELGDDVRAEAFERLSGLPGLAPSALSDLATRVRALGEPQVGLDLAERGLQLDALGPELWFELGQCRRALGDRAGAREALSTARGLVDVEHRPALDDALRALDAEEGR